MISGDRFPNFNPMEKIIEGQLRNHGKRIGIVVSRFNDFITKRLLNACLNELKHRGIKENEIVVVWVPGSFEIPLIASTLAKKKTIGAVICLGAIIRGETIHFDLVAYGATYGIQQAAIITGKPMIFGVLATDTVHLAYKRSEEKGDNKGRDAAVAALEMLDVMKKLSKSTPSYGGQ